MDNPDQSYTPGESQTYAEDRLRRLRRRRVVGYLVCIALWLLSAVPLARLSSEEGGGADVAAAFLAAGLALAVISRGIYAWRRKRRFWSPWLFVVAAVLAITSYGVQSAGEKVPSASVEGPVAEALRGHSPGLIRPS
jgi:membrane protease YdiL (CAAX protease family)